MNDEVLRAQATTKAANKVGRDSGNIHSLDKGERGIINDATEDIISDSKKVDMRKKNKIKRKMINYHF